MGSFYDYMMGNVDAYDVMVTRRAMKDRRPPLVIKRCERDGCTNEIRQRTHGKGRKYCGPECRKLARKVGKG